MDLMFCILSYNFYHHHCGSHYSYSFLSLPAVYPIPSLRCCLFISDCSLFLAVYSISDVLNVFYLDGHCNNVLLFIIMENYLPNSYFSLHIFGKVRNIFTVSMLFFSLLLCCFLLYSFSNKATVI